MNPMLTLPAALALLATAFLKMMEAQPGTDEEPQLETPESFSVGDATMVVGASRNTRKDDKGRLEIVVTIRASALADSGPRRLNDSEVDMFCELWPEANRKVKINRESVATVLVGIDFDTAHLEHLSKQVDAAKPPKKSKSVKRETASVAPNTSSITEPPVASPVSPSSPVKPTKPIGKKSKAEQPRPTCLLLREGKGKENEPRLRKGKGNDPKVNNELIRRADYIIENDKLTKSRDSKTLDEVRAEIKNGSIDLIVYRA